MSRNLQTLVLLAILLAASAVAILLTAYAVDDSTTSQQRSPFSRGPYLPNAADLDFYYVARTVFSTINIVLLVVLIINYVSIYLKTRSEFTIGLTMFAVFFLIKDITWSPFVVYLSGYNMFGLGPFAFLPDLFELIGLSMLLYLTVRY